MYESIYDLIDVERGVVNYKKKSNKYIDYEIVYVDSYEYINPI